MDLTPTIPQLKEIINNMSALINKERYAILQFLIEHEVRKPNGVSVGEVMKYFGHPQPKASQLLATLRQAGFVKNERDGRYVRYLPNHQHIENLNEIATIFVKRGTAVAAEAE